MLSTDYDFARFDKVVHLRAGFDCGLTVLNDFILKYASQQQDKDLTTVYVCTKRTDKIPKNIYGYYTLSANAISPSIFPVDMANKLPRDQLIPTIKIGRLARNIKLTTSGFGNILLGDALYRSYRISRNVGSLAVDVDAKNDKLVNFYKRHGFVKLNATSNCLIVPMKTLAKSLVAKMESKVVAYSD